MASGAFHKSERSFGRKMTGIKTGFSYTMIPVKEKFLHRNVLIRIGLAVLLSVLYGILSGQFVLRFIDGLSIAAVLFLLAGVLNYWWKEGFFAFFTWKKRDEASFLTYREQLREERKNTENHSLYAGLALLVISLFLTVFYMILR